MVVRLSRVRTRLAGGKIFSILDKLRNAHSRHCGGLTWDRKRRAAKITDRITVLSQMRP